ncbi:MAG: aminopeptidase P family protein [Proteobacteria bacterium]|nr:aminopeptidase P family protein [Pseudomonadota bacterium]
MVRSRRTSAPPPLAVEEYRRRVGRIQEAMAAERLDALLITSEDNYRYVTGFNSPTWQNLTRPRFCIVPLAGDPCVIVPSNNTVIVEETSWIRDVRSWVSPNPADDGVSLVREGLRACPRRHNRVGAELGPESRLTMPVGDFLRLREAIAPVEIVDGDRMLRRLRMIKSPAEVARIRHVAEIVSRGFEALASRTRIGETERAVCRRLHADLLARGADRGPYVVGTSGRGGYSSLNLPPRERALRQGDVLFIDIAAAYDGYYCDFDREIAFGRPSDKLRRIYEVLWRATEAGIAAARPGRPIAEVWQAEADAVARAAERLRLLVEPARNGRLGHGVGLRMCEPPSVHPEDMTVLEAGMAITIAPALAFAEPSADGPQGRLAVHEENIVITGDGAELLTRRAPPEMPFIAE